MQWFRTNAFTLVLSGGVAVLVLAGILMWWFSGKEPQPQSPAVSMAPSAGGVNAGRGEAARTSSAAFRSISVGELSEMLAAKDFTLIDVHIPEQVHIPGTDYLIPYNEMDALAAALPDKDAKVVLYCRSGGMSKMAARALAARGYTNVYELDGGMIAWEGAEMPVVPKGSVASLAQ